MQTLATVNGALAAIVGLITGIVSWRLFRKALGIHNPGLAVCVGALTGLGLAGHGGGSELSGLLIPYEALGICVVLVLLLGPLVKVKKEQKKLLPGDPKAQSDVDDPWEKEIRKGGELARRFKRRERGVSP
jgi:Na+/proline symporter